MCQCLQWSYIQHLLDQICLDLLFHHHYLYINLPQLFRYLYPIFHWNQFQYEPTKQSRQQLKLDYYQQYLINLLFWQMQQYQIQTALKIMQQHQLPQEYQKRLYLQQQECQNWQYQQHLNLVYKHDQEIWMRHLPINFLVQPILFNPLS